MTDEPVQNSAPQTNEAAETTPREDVVANACRTSCTAITKAGNPCHMSAIVGSRPPRCWSHTAGGPQAAGRIGGLNRRRRPLPEPKRTMRLPGEAERPADCVVVADLDADPMSAGEVRMYLQSAVTKALAGLLNPELAKVAIQATGPWLAAIQLDERIADVEKRLATLEGHSTGETP